MIWGSKSSKILQLGSEYSLEVCQSFPSWNIRLHLRESQNSTFSPELQISKNLFWNKIIHYDTDQNLSKAKWKF